MGKTRQEYLYNTSMIQGVFTEQVLKLRLASS